MSSSDASGVQTVHRSASPGDEWDLDKNVVDLEGGMQLIYEGGGALSAGACGVIFPCKLKLGKEVGYRVIDAVVKCENRKCNDKDGYEIHKVRKIPPHDYLVKFYDGKVLGPGESGNFGALMVFERMECNLKQLVSEDSPFEEACTYWDLVDILQQVTQGLMHLHSKGFLHLDLKPQNVLVSKDHEGNFLVKIADFGLAKAMIGGHSTTATHRGTRQFMAPEVYHAPRFRESSKRITELADVYSFGILMYVLSEQQGPPFTTQAWGSCGQKIAIGDVQPQKVFCGAPLEMCGLIKKCVRFNSSGMDDSRKHGRPSFEKILTDLRTMKKCKWVTQTSQTQENVNKREENLSRSLMKAAADGNIQTVKNLLNRVAYVNLLDNEIGLSALHHACENGHTEVAKVLLESGADVDLVDTEHRWSALHHACAKGYTEVTRLLLEKGADVKLEDNNGFTALYLSRYHGHTEITNLLCCGVFFNAVVVDINQVDNNGVSPLQPARMLGYTEITEITKIFLEAGADVNIVDNNGMSALHHAVRSGHFQSTKLLLEAGANVELKDNNGKTALDYALENLEE